MDEYSDFAKQVIKAEESRVITDNSLAAAIEKWGRRSPEYAKYYDEWCAEAFKYIPYSAGELLCPSCKRVRPITTHCSLCHAKLPSTGAAITKGKYGF